MPNPQETPALSAGMTLRASDFGWLAAYAARGLAELVRARLIFARLKASDIPVRNQAAMQRSRHRDRDDGLHLRRVAYVLPRLSARLPWRSDCLVQAVAAQNWLSARGLPGEIQIGIERPADGPFGAHAWLVCNGAVITGGDIDRYARLLGVSPLPESSAPEVPSPPRDTPANPPQAGRKPSD